VNVPFRVERAERQFGSALWAVVPFLRIPTVGVGFSGGALVADGAGALRVTNALAPALTGEVQVGLAAAPAAVGQSLMVESGDPGANDGGNAPNNGGNGSGNFRQQVEQAVQDEWAARGDFTSDAMSLEHIEGPHQVANLDPALGPNQVRYQTTFLNEATGERINISVNFDPTTGQFGTIKPSSIQP
jgi:hypothetical protein